MKRMKVAPWNRQLWCKYLVVLSTISTIASLIFLFADIPSTCKKYFLLGMMAILVVLFLIQWIQANRIKRVTLKINNSDVVIEEGDIFKSDGYRIIPFNEYFDTQVDGELISRQTINGKYIVEHVASIEEIDRAIDNDQHAKSCISGQVSNRVLGKKKRYVLGTIIKDTDYFMMAFSKFDSQNRAYLEMNEYITCLMNMWNECDIHYGGRSIALPLLGSGITRFHSYENITDQELLEIILWTFKVSRIRFQYPSQLRIVLTKNSLDKINLFELKSRFKS
jgi:hypothetical protein